MGDGQPLLTLKQINRLYSRELFISAGEIAERVQSLAGQIQSGIGYDSVVAVTVLKGAAPFSKNLRRALSARGHPVETQYTKLHSYSGTESTGTITIDKKLPLHVERRRVMVFEDILDTGRSMRFLIPHLLEHGAISVDLCILLDKPENRLDENGNLVKADQQYEGALFGGAIGALTRARSDIAPRPMQMVMPSLRGCQGNLIGGEVYTGFAIPNAFVVGNGLDLDEHFRRLKDIYALHKR